MVAKIPNLSRSLPCAPRIVPEWCVSLPTYRGVLIQWGGAYLGITVESRPFLPRGSLKRIARALRAQCNYLGVWPY